MDWYPLVFLNRCFVMANPNVLGLVCALKMKGQSEFWLKATDVAEGDKVVVKAGTAQWDGTIDSVSNNKKGARARVTMDPNSNPTGAFLRSELVELSITITNSSGGSGTAAISGGMWTSQPSKDRYQQSDRRRRRTQRRSGHYRLSGCRKQNYRDASHQRLASVEFNAVVSSSR